jgi:hypothetical protein
MAHPATPLSSEFLVVLSSHTPSFRQAHYFASSRLVSLLLYMSAFFFADMLLYMSADEIYIENQATTTAFSMLQRT